MSSVLSLSPEIRMQQQEAKKRLRLNRCPCGCDVADLEADGRCKHYIGCTNDGKLMEPMKQRYFWREDPESGKKRKQPSGYWYLDGANQVPIPTGAILVPVEMSSRVYHPDGVPNFTHHPRSDELAAEQERDRALDVETEQRMAAETKAKKK